FALDNGKGTFGFERAVKVFLKNVPLIPIAFRMLFPNHWITRRGKQRIEVVRPERAQLDQITLQGRLKINYFLFHCAPPSSGRTKRFAKISMMQPARTTRPKRCVGGKSDKTKMAKPAAMMTSE